MKNQHFFFTFSLIIYYIEGIFRFTLLSNDVDYS